MPTKRLVLTAVALVIPAASAVAVPCKRICKPAIQRCVETGAGTRRQCKRQLIRQCRQLGRRSCDEAFLPSTTTTSTTASFPTTTSATEFISTTTTLPPASLDALVGTWDLTYTITSAVTDEYVLQTLTTANNGLPLLLGYEVRTHDSVSVARVQDLNPGSPLPYAFGLLDQGTLCEFYTFNPTSPTTVAGEVVVELTASDGSCDPSTKALYPFTGLRVGP